jgi:hypothetical protein
VSQLSEHLINCEFFNNINKNWHISSKRNVRKLFQHLVHLPGSFPDLEDGGRQSQEAENGFKNLFPACSADTESVKYAAPEHFAHLEGRKIPARIIDVEDAGQHPQIDAAVTICYSIPAGTVLTQSAPQSPVVQEGDVRVDQHASSAEIDAHAKVSVCSLTVVIGHVQESAFGQDLQIEHGVVG